MSARWNLPSPFDPQEQQLVSALARELGCPPVLAGILFRRGVWHPETAEHFLAPKLKLLSDPFLLPDMRLAANRTLAAIDRGERIVLYGDYDVDGVTSLALLTRLLQAYGAKPEAFLPSRMDEGYGLSPDGVARCIETYSPQLLIALDCGTSAANEIAKLTAQGVDVVVIDHHECQEQLPRCAALVNPKRPDTSAGLDYLCSVGLVFKFCHALLKTRPAPGFDLRETLDIVALGTVADIVPLIGENRILVQKGLETMGQTRWPGLLALMEVAGVNAPVTPGDVAYKLGPRLNASGRLGTARESLELLLTDDLRRARALAMSLDAQNRDRQRVEKKTLEEAESSLGADPAKDAAIVVSATGWHPGVLGIVASRICRQHHRPTFVIGFDETGLGRGSGRSIAGFSLVEALAECKHLLEKFGGHEMAAGLALRQEHFPAFRDAFKACARARLDGEKLLRRISVDGELDIGDATLEFLGIHEQLQPFGMGNAQPLFLARNIRPVNDPIVLKEKHLRLTLVQNRARHEAVFFNGAANSLPRPPWDIAFRIERNTWRGRSSVQMQIQHIRSTAG